MKIIQESGKKSKKGNYVELRGSLNSSLDEKNSIICRALTNGCGPKDRFETGKVICYSQVACLYLWFMRLKMAAKAIGTLHWKLQRFSNLDQEGSVISESADRSMLAGRSLLKMVLALLVY